MRLVPPRVSLSETLRPHPLKGEDRYLQTLQVGEKDDDEDEDYCGEEGGRSAGVTLCLSFCVCLSLSLSLSLASLSFTCVEPGGVARQRGVAFPDGEEDEEERAEGQTCLREGKGSGSRQERVRWTR